MCKTCNEIRESIKRAVPTVTVDEPAVVRVDVEGRVIAMCPNCEQEWKGGKIAEEAKPTVRKTPLSITCQHCFCCPKLDPIINGKMVVMCCKCLRYGMASVHIDVV